MPSRGFKIPIYDRPVYTRGSGPPMMPVTLTPPDDHSGWIIKEKVIIDGVPRYIVFHPDKPHYCPAVRLEKVLDWVSQRVYENFEFDLVREQDRNKWERDEKILKAAEKIVSGRAQIANQASAAQQATHPGRKGKKATSGLFQINTDETRVVDNGQHDIVEDVPKSVLAQFAQPSPRSKLKRKRIEQEIKSSPLKSLSLLAERPPSSSQPSLSEEARRLQPSLSQPSLTPTAFEQEFTEDDLSGEGSTVDIMRPRSGSSLRQKSPNPMLPPTTVFRSRSISKSVSQSGRLSTRSSRSISMRMGSPSAERLSRRSSGRLVSQEDWNVVPRSESSQIHSLRAKTHEVDFSEVHTPKIASVDNRNSTTNRLEESAPPRRKQKVPKSSKKKKAPEETWEVEDILDHEYREEGGEGIIYYLIEWKCDYPGQWDPSWEPETNVGQGSKDEYYGKIVKIDTDMPSGRRTQGANRYGANDEDDEFDSITPSKQIIDELKTEVETPNMSEYGSDTLPGTEVIFVSSSKKQTQKQKQKPKRESRHSSKSF